MLELTDVAAIQTLDLITVFTNAKLLLRSGTTRQFINHLAKHFFSIFVHVRRKYFKIPSRSSVWNRQSQLPDATVGCVSLYSAFQFTPFFIFTIVGEENA